MFYILSADLLNEIVVFSLLNTYAAIVCVYVCALSSCKCFMAQKRNIKLKNA